MTLEKYLSSFTKSPRKIKLEINGKETEKDSLSQYALNCEVKSAVIERNGFILIAKIKAY